MNGRIAYPQAIDWREWDGTRINVLRYLADASRTILAEGELDAINTENGIRLSINSRKILEALPEVRVHFRSCQ